MDSSYSTLCASSDRFFFFFDAYCTCDMHAGLLTNITPHGVKMLREMFNNSAVDVMYYTSPRFGPEVRTYVYMYRINSTVLSA